MVSIEEKKNVAIAIDVDNLLIPSFLGIKRLRGYSIESGFDRIFDWTETFGKIIRVDFYMPPQKCMYNDSLWNNIWEKYKDKFHLDFHNCPRKRIEKEGKKIKIDNVDTHLIYNTKDIIKNLNGQINYFCLAAGDIDYSALLWELKRENQIEVAFVIGSEESFSETYNKIGIIAKHPISGEKLIHYFLPQK